jgi:predicted dehydrogenase
MAASTQIRIGIVGAGQIVRDRHMPGFAALPDVQVVAVCSSRWESAKKFCADFGVREIERRWEDLVERQDLDVIWIGAPPMLHAPVAIAALTSGKHVFCQARMAMNLAEAKKMLAAARKRPRQTTMLCPAPHGLAGGATFLQMLRAGHIGTPWHFRLHALANTYADAAAPAHWRQRVEVSGANVLSVGIFVEVLGRWLGWPRSVMAQTKVAVPVRDGYEVRLPDVVHVFGEWPGGLAGALTWSGVSSHPPDERLELYGSEGTLVYVFGEDRILFGKRGSPALREIPIPKAQRGVWTVERDFFEAVAGRQPSPEPSFETGVRYMAIIDAIHRSAREGVRIDL